jgi:hypothetical protein
MTVSYRNTFCDRLAFASYHMPRNPLILLAAVGCFLFMTFGAVVPAVRELPADKPAFIKVLAFIFIELLLALFIVVLLGVITLLALISRRNKPQFCQKTITLGGEAFVGESQYGRSETRWTMVQKLARTRRYIFIYLGQENAIVIPRRAFASVTEWDTFYGICGQRTKAANEKRSH